MKKNKDWKLLYKLAGIAPLITIFLYLCQFIFISWENYPGDIEQWYVLFNEDKLLALFYLNSLDMISIGVLGVMFLGLSIRLKDENRPLIIIALPFAFIGIAVFIIPRSLLLSLIQLSQQYSEASSEVVKTQILTSGHAISTFGVPTFQTAGFFIISISSLLISVVILRSNLFPKIAGYIGTAGFILTMLDDFFVIKAPGLSSVFMIIGGGFWIVWWIIISISLIGIKSEYTG